MSRQLDCLLSQIWYRLKFWLTHCQNKHLLIYHFGSWYALINSLMRLSNKHIYNYKWGILEVYTENAIGETENKTCSLQLKHYFAALYLTHKIKSIATAEKGSLLRQLVNKVHQFTQFLFWDRIVGKLLLSKQRRDT